jgi:hypothetical protein
LLSDDTGIRFREPESDDADAALGATDNGSGT